MSPIQHADQAQSLLPLARLRRPAPFCDAPRSQEVDPQFEPVHKLTEQVAVTTGEEGDAVIFKMCVSALAPHLTAIDVIGSTGSSC